jgi:hypothetical protein
MLCWWQFFNLNRLEVVISSFLGAYVPSPRHLTQEDRKLIGVTSIQGMQEWAFSKLTRKDVAEFDHGWD